MNTEREDVGLGFVEQNRPSFNPITAIRKRNRKIKILLLAGAFALVAAFLIVVAPEIGFVASATGSIMAGGGSALLTVLSKR